jgi:hypothetical protein
MFESQCVDVSICVAMTGCKRRSVVGADARAQSRQRLAQVPISMSRWID